MVKICEEKYTDGTEARRMRLLALRNLARFYNGLDSGDMYLTTAEADRLLKSVEDFLVLYSALATKAMNDKKLKYSIVNKHHMMWHLAQAARYMNPKYQWCFMAEDFMRVMVKVSFAALMGSPTLRLSAKAIERWRIGRYFEIERQLDV